MRLSPIQFGGNVEVTCAESNQTVKTVRGSGAADDTMKMRFILLVAPLMAALHNHVEGLLKGAEF